MSERSLLKRDRMTFMNNLAEEQHQPQRLHIENPLIRTSEEERLWKEATSLAKLVPHEPEPNMGRVQEIKEEIKKGNYVSSDKIEETAARLAIRFMRKE